MAVEEFEQLNDDDTIIIDTRMEVSFASAHIPDAISIWQEGLPGIAGWFVPEDNSVLLVSDHDYPETAIKYLSRIGIDQIKGYLAGGLVNWHMAGKKK